MGECYSSVMDFLYRVSMWIAGIALLVMVAIIPIGIFARYVLNNALSWPEPVAILCMVTFTFIGAAVSYRAGSHIAVSMVTDRLGEIFPPLLLGSRRRYVNGDKPVHSVVRLHAMPRTVGTARGGIPNFKRRAKLSPVADWLCYYAAVYR